MYFLVRLEVRRDLKMLKFNRIVSIELLLNETGYKIIECLYQEKATILMCNLLFWLRIVVTSI